MTWLAPQTGEVPLPPVTAVSAPFWDACADHRLLFQRCGACGAAVFNPASVCRACRSADLRWERSAGRGHLYSWTVAWRPQTPAFTVPYAPVIVDLDEGYQMLSNVVGCDVADLRVGLPVEVCFHPVPGRTLPYFRPAPG